MGRQEGVKKSGLSQAPAITFVDSQGLSGSAADCPSIFGGNIMATKAQIRANRLRRSSPVPQRADRHSRRGRSPQPPGPHRLPPRKWRAPPGGRGRPPGRPSFRAACFSRGPRPRKPEKTKQANFRLTTVESMGCKRKPHQGFTAHANTVHETRHTRNEPRFHTPQGSQNNETRPISPQLPGFRGASGSRRSACTPVANRSYVS